jgi:hypothetical protein
MDTVFEVFTDEQDAVDSFFPGRPVRQYDVLAFVQEQEKASGARSYACIKRGGPGRNGEAKRVCFHSRMKTCLLRVRCDQLWKCGELPSSGTSMGRITKCSLK